MIRMSHMLVLSEIKHVSFCFITDYQCFTCIGRPCSENLIEKVSVIVGNKPSGKFLGLVNFNLVLSSVSLPMNLLT